MGENTKVIFLTLKTAPMHSNYFSATVVYIPYIRQQSPVTYTLGYFFFALHYLASGYWFTCIDCFHYL